MPEVLKRPFTAFVSTLHMTQRIRRRGSLSVGRGHQAAAHPLRSSAGLWPTDMAFLSRGSFLPLKPTALLCVPGLLEAGRGPGDKAPGWGHWLWEAISAGTAPGAGRPEGPPAW